MKSTVANCNLRCIGAGCLAEEKKRGTLSATLPTTETNEPGPTTCTTGGSSTKRWMPSSVSPIQPPPQPSSREAAAGVMRSLLERESHYEQQQLQALGHIPSSGDDRNADNAAMESTTPAISPAILPEVCDIGPIPTTNSSSKSNDGHFYICLPPEPGQAEKRTPTQVSKRRTGGDRDV